MKKLDIEFFKRDANIVAKELLGKVFHFYNYKAIICETESYDQYDPASHSYSGKVTKRNQIMYENAGHIYVYLIYGIYYCLNFVTGNKGEGSAVLIRALYFSENKVYINGPGKVCKYLNITKIYNGNTIIDNKNIFIIDIGNKLPFDCTPRIGITKGKDYLKRFIIKKEYLNQLR